MVDEETGNRCMRAVPQKGLGEGHEMDWLIQDMSLEVESWGHSGGSGSKLIMKSDGEASIKAIRDALSKYHGGKVTPEQPPRGESQANGRVEEMGKTIRGLVRQLKDQIEHQTKGKISSEEEVLQWVQDGRQCYTPGSKWAGMEQHHMRGRQARNSTCRLCPLRRRSSTRSSTN